MAYVKNDNESGHRLELRDLNGMWVEHGDTVEVPDELAGHPPKGHPDDENYDPGSGLLAQPSNWKPSTKKAFEEAAKKREATVDVADQDTATADEEAK